MGNIISTKFLDFKLRTELFTVLTDDVDEKEESVKMK